MPSHPRHAELRGASTAVSEPTQTELEAETVRDAVETGKTLALGQYAYLIGATADELLPITEATTTTQTPMGSPPKARRYVNGKEAQTATAKRRPAQPK